jgi:hypothetical protein
VGYRCKECVRVQQTGFDTTRSSDYPIAFVVAFFGVGIGVYLVRFLGFWGFFLSPVIGGGLAEILRRLISNRRSRRLPLIAAIGGVIGVVIHLFPLLLSLYPAVFSSFELTALIDIAISALWPIAYGFLIISTLFYRIRDIRL